jgi:hypothetical protein
VGKRDPILRCELRELRVEQPAQDFRALPKVPRDGELSPRPSIRSLSLSKPSGSMTGPMSLRMTPAMAAGLDTASIMASRPP